MTLAFAFVSCEGEDSSPPVAVAPTPAPTPAPPPTNDLITAAQAFPAMAKDLAGLLNQGLINSATFASGTPYNDLEYTLFDTDYVEGETDGFDTFMPVDPSDEFPGSDSIKLINGVNNLDLDSSYSGPSGNRVILGTAEIDAPFFSAGSDGIDNDYVILTNFDYNNGYIQLRGSASDYGLVRCTTADGCATDGKAFRMLTVIDEHSRQCLAIHVQRKLKSDDVLAVLTEPFLCHGPPDHIRSDNGAEFTAHAVRDWLGRSA